MGRLSRRSSAAQTLPGWGVRTLRSRLGSEILGPFSLLSLDLSFFEVKIMPPYLWRMLLSKNERSVYSKKPSEADEDCLVVPGT